MTKAEIVSQITEKTGIEKVAVEPPCPPVYILVDGDCNVRWMTKEEAVAYQMDSDLCLKKAVLLLEHSIRKEQN